jgi:benzoyl-CoA reductase subunit C
MSESDVNEAMNRFRDVVDRPYEKLGLWKKSNQVKIVGCSPMHFPEELIHAAGMLPVLLQETEEAVTEGFSHVHPFFCGITRNMIDICTKGQLNFFDALFYSDICIQNRNAACTLRNIMPAGHVEFVQFPTCLNREGVLANTLHELQKIKARLENLSGRKIDDTSLMQSIQLFNKNRSLLRQLHELFKIKPRVLPFRDRQIIVKAAMLMPKEEHTELVESLLTELQAIESHPPQGPKLFLSGHLCQGPKTDILDLIERAGGIIVDDDLYTGYRYYATDVKINGSPIEAIAERYIDKSVPIPTRSDEKIKWDRYVVDKAKESRAQGVVVLMAKYCEPHLFLYPFIKRALNEAGIPHLMVETEHEVVSLEGIRTRLQAFIEMLGQEKAIE